ncbi:hypothetical protein GCM10009760_27360 [Kitasatospora kazusensis]|uniref:Uncharacterized protein n=1 Tax=Kitasatospora kazusensis TaxID=407974 RepID=A0ABP5L6A4_9ACTN
MTLDQFIAVSAELTGFDTDELRGTGLAGLYRTVLLERAGAEQLSRLTAPSPSPIPGEVGTHADEPQRELARAVTHLWYTGTWTGTGQAADEPFVVSARAYAGGLVWRSFGGHAPGTTPQGYGSWAAAPAARPAQGTPGARPTTADR